MLSEKYRSKLHAALDKNRSYTWIIGALMLSNLMLAYKIISISVDEKVIIHPLSAKESYWFEDDKVDPYYLESFAKEFIQGRFFYNPKTVHSQFESLVKHFHPSIYGKKRAELSVKADEVERKGESSVFYPMSIHVKKDNVYVTGEIEGYIGKKHISTRKKTFEVEFRHSSGRIWLYDWQEVELDSRGKDYVPVEKNA